MRYCLTESLSELLDVDIKERGVNALLLCPFHEDSTASFSIHLEEGVWHCFGCGKKGGLNKLYRLMGEEMSDELYQDRLMKSIETRERERKNFMPLTNKHIKERYTDVGKTGLARYLSLKGLSEDTVSFFSLGWDKSRNAVSMPYWDEDYIVEGIKYRLADGSKRSEEGSIFNLYAVEFARGKRTVAICEGESDTHSMWNKISKANSFGVCGVSGAVHDSRTWEKWALDLMFAVKIYLAMDNDEAGDKGYEAAISVLGEDKCVRLRPVNGKDVSEHFINGGSLYELGVEEEDLV